MKSSFEKYSVSKLDRIKQEIDRKIGEFKNNLKTHLKKNNPFFDNQKKYKKQLRRLKIEDYTIETFRDDVEGFEELSKLATNKFDNEVDYFKQEIIKYEKLSTKIESKSKISANFSTKLKKNITISKKLLLKKWGENLTKEHNLWIERETKRLQKEFVTKTQKWLQKVQTIHNRMKDLSIDDNMLFDLSAGELSSSDLKEIEKWVTYISENKKVKQLCDMLGRLRSAKKKNEKKLVEVTKEIIVTLKETTSKEEIVGLKFDNKLEYVTPQEMMLINDEETEILFYKKFAEKALLSFDSNSLGEIEKETISQITQKELQNVSKDDKQGPIILCVDTSGSMMGEPENIAKAVSLYIASQAKAQKRDCFLINFSTSIETFDFSSKLGLKELIIFLQKSFHGGTDITPALKYALKVMESKNYKKADLLVISDFAMGDVGKELKNKIELAKKRENRFFSLIIGENIGQINKIFDKEWVFNSYSNTLIELDNILKRKKL